MLPLLLVAGAYLFGSIPFSYLIVRFLSGDDIREHGSGNVGATNVLRNFGKLPGILALILDLLKGLAAVALARELVASSAWPRFTGTTAASPAFWIGLAALVAVVAHMAPVWLRLKGGKGVATAAGAFLGLDPLALVAAILVFALVLVAFRYVSLASIAGAAMIPVAMRFMTGVPFWTLIFSIVIAGLIIFKHNTNIARLARGEERKFPR